MLIRGSGKEKAKKEQNDLNKIKETIENGVTYIEPMGGVSRKRTTPGGKVSLYLVIFKLLVISHSEIEKYFFRKHIQRPCPS